MIPRATPLRTCLRKTGRLGFRIDLQTQRPPQGGLFIGALRAIRERYSDLELGFHVHNTAGNGLANVLAAMDAGIDFVEGAICGIGGGIMTPTSMASVGNLATEDLVHFLNTMGVETGVSTEAVLAAARDIAHMLDIRSNAFVAACGTRKSIMDEARSHQRFHPA